MNIFYATSPADDQRKSGRDPESAHELYGIR